MNEVLNKRIDQFFESDIVDLRKYPDAEVASALKYAKKYSVLDLSQLNPGIRKELQEFLKNELDRLAKNTQILNQNLLLPISVLISFMVDNPKASILDYSDDEKAYFKDYFQQYTTIKYRKDTGAIVTKFYNFIKVTKDSKKDFFDRDIWNLSELNLSEDRINRTLSAVHLDFSSIQNIQNRRYVKLYFKYLVGITDNALTTIKKTFDNISEFCSVINDTLITNLTQDDIDDYLTFVEEKHTSVNNYNTKANDTKCFLIYLTKQRIIDEMVFNFLHKNHHYEYKELAVDDYVTFQIFACLNNLEEKYALMYMIAYVTGIRASEICSLKIGCLRKEKDCCLLKYYSIKMRKDGYSLIPNSLYNLLKAWEEKVLEGNENAIYLFSREKDYTQPCTTRLYYEYLREFIKESNIVNPDGTPYKFRSHACRHTIAKDLVEADVPLFVISQVLNHNSMDMTACYAEIRDEHRKRKFAEFIGSDLKASTVDVEWLRKNANKQALSNGFCCMPCSQSCTAPTHCIHCEFFATNSDYLDVHKDFLERLKVNLETSEKNNWLPKVATLKKDISQLQKIIDTLEKEKGG